MKKQLIDRLDHLEKFMPVNGVVTPLFKKMIKAGWTVQDIDDWNEALSKARQALLREQGFDDLDLRSVILKTCERAVDFVESPTLLARLEESLKSEATG